jgi:uncharacterized protein
LDPKKVLKKYYGFDASVFEMLVQHGELIAEKAVCIAEKLNFSETRIKLIEETAMLHDIGIYLTNAPQIGCYGKYPYICHGYLGGDILRKEKLAEHAIIAERHVGVGISRQDVEKEKLPLPEREMRPRSTEEKILCYADKFYSKALDLKVRAHTSSEIKSHLKKFGQEKVLLFQSWETEFEKC